TYIKISGSRTIRSNELVPMDFVYPHVESEELFLSLEEKMICVPYDNDMWVHYDSLPLRPGRTSYDVTAIYDDRNMKGMIIGALDFDTWKNAIVCSAYDARSFRAVSGIADAQTHDHLPHGYLEGKEITSSRFICGFYDDVRDGLEEYGRLCINGNGVYHWDHGVPFGWNSYSALTLMTRLKDVETAGDFIHEDLENFRSEDGATYINFDSVINIDRNRLIKLIKKLHGRNQKVGWYLNPLSHLSINDDVQLKGSKKHYKDILMRNDDGSLYPPIDNKYPIDITIPEAELDLRLKLREIVDLDFDYLKIDFLSHGAVEGKRYDRNIRTGRQALTYFYEIIKEELDPEKIGREMFISFSIDPLFPCGYSHARRSCCDSFGHVEDVRYVLNSLTYGFWTNGTLYQFCDPDHTVLFNSLVDGRKDTTLAEARSRYNASIISGTVMLLSDDYRKDEAKERTLKLANNKKLNELARLNKAFRPLTLSDTSNVYYLNDNNDYLAVFNFGDKTQTFEIDPSEINVRKKGTLLNLNTNKRSAYQKIIKVDLKPYDSAIFKVN
ncbi:MAG: hypothetical protein IKX97_01880, partial [Erysipelotrichaceae bacterium]|nr:hypothetical protein [Erysipelotrichaceae bacterium]